jgi:hypothetical protein
MGRRLPRVPAASAALDRQQGYLNQLWRTNPTVVV